MFSVTSFLGRVPDGQVQAEVQRMERQTHHLSPCTFLPKAAQKHELCHLRQISWPDKWESPYVSVFVHDQPCAVRRHARPLNVTSFEVKRDRYVRCDFDFRVVCHTKLSINCLIHEIGERLNCGAHVRHSRRIRLGHISESDAWNAEDLMEYIAYLRRLAFLKDFDLYDRMKHAYWRSIGPRTNKQKKRIKRRWEGEQKKKRQIKEGIRRPVMTDLCY